MIKLTLEQIGDLLHGKSVVIDEESDIIIEMDV